MPDKDFLETIYEIALGDDAINKDYTQQDVINALRTLSDDYCAAIELLTSTYSSFDEFENAKKEFLGDF